MFSTSVYPCKRLFMKQTHKSVLCGYFLHYLHCKLIMVCCNIGCRIYRRKLVLSRSNLVMLCFCKYSKLPQLSVKIIHIFRNARFNHSEIMIVHFLSFRRLRSEKSTSCKNQILALIIKLFIYKKILLFRTDRCTDTFNIIFSKQM